MPRRISASWCSSEKSLARALALAAVTVPKDSFFGSPPLSSLGKPVSRLAVLFFRKDARTWRGEAATKGAWASS